MVAEDDGRRASTSREQNDLPVVDLWFSGVRELTRRMRRWISTDGIFVATPDPQPPSSVARVRLILADGFVLTEGTAVVTWARSASEDPACESGMGMRWVVLPEASRRVIEQLVEEHQADGGRAFDPDHLPEGDLPTDDMEGFAPLEDQPTVVRSLPDLAVDGQVAATAPDDGAEPCVAPEADAQGWSLAPRASGLDQAEDLALERFPPDDARSGTSADHGAGLYSGATGASSTEPPLLPSQAVVEGSAGPELPGPGPVADRSRAAESVATELEIVMPDEDDLSGEYAPRRRSVRPVLWAVVAALVVTAAVVALLLRASRSETSSESLAVPSVPASQDRVNVPEPTSAPTIGEEDLVEPTGTAGIFQGEPAAEPTAAPSRTPPAPPEADASSGEAGEAVGGLPNGPSRAVIGITWRRRGEETVVELQLGAGLAPDTAIVSAMSHPARVLVRFPGVVEPFSQLLIPVSSPELTQIRSWLHSELRPPELHVVLDLAREGVALLEVRRERSSVVLVLGSARKSPPATPAG